MDSRRARLASEDWLQELSKREKRFIRAPCPLAPLLTVEEFADGAWMEQVPLNEDPCYPWPLFSFISTNYIRLIFLNSERGIHGRKSQGRCWPTYPLPLPRLLSSSSLPWPPFPLLSIPFVQLLFIL